MTPFYFGDASRRLFGVWHAGDSWARPSSAVLLCNPFGQSAIRVHRLYKALATQLAKVGVSTLRFDFYGTGDSDGSDEESEIEGWRLDVLTAHQELLRRAGMCRTAWLAAGLGGSVALQTCTSDATPDRLVLWDPVVNGAAYLDELNRRHVESLESTFGLPPGYWHRLGRDARFPHEIMGFAVSPVLRRQLETLDLSSVNPPTGIALHVVTDSGNRRVLDWAERWRHADTGMEVTSLDDAFDWHAEQLLGAALVPATTLRNLVAVLADQ